MQTFNSTLSEFSQDPQRNSEPVWVFHGTIDEVVEKIMLEGLKVGGTQGIPIRHSQVYGPGIYTSLRSDGALHKETKKVIMCKALKGLTAVRPQNQKLQAPYNCFADGSSMLVFREPRQLLPMYVIHFTT